MEEYKTKEEFPILIFLIESGSRKILVDTGGGNGIMTQLEKAGIPMETIHDIFISHEHTDHLLGLIWLIRMIATKMKKGQYEGNLNIYCHEELVDTILTITKLTVQKKFYKMIGEQIFFRTVEDGEVYRILGYDVCFFDIQSTKAKQFGYALRFPEGVTLVCLGDEPYNERCRPYAEGADWLLAEAFCLYEDRERFRPYEKCHSTVKEASETAESLGAKHLVLYHTEDKTLASRKKRYTAEARLYYGGDVHVPDDLERIALIP